MADDRLRELERRWKSSGAVEDEVALLLERMRVGDLEEDRLRLAAHLGHAASRGSLGDGGPDPGVESWIRGLLHELWLRSGKAWAVEAQLRVFLAICQTGPRTTSPGSSAAGEREAWEALSAAEESVLCPCPAHVGLLQRNVERLSAYAHTHRGRPPRGVPPVVTYPPHPWVSLVYEVARSAANALSGGEFRLWTEDRHLEQIEESVDPSVVRDELISWVLGYRDLVRERVETRKRRSRLGDSNEA
jgi:hypothetical protein